MWWWNFIPPIAVDGGRKKIAALAEETVRDGLRRALAGGRAVTAASAPGTEEGALAEARSKALQGDFLRSADAIADNRKP